MNNFEILCVTMHQKDFSKIREMNINSNVIFANQSDKTSYEEYDFKENKAKMISTQTRGVGINRNISLMYATADICLFADDDMYYYDELENKIVNEFNSHPEADIIIFNIDSDSIERKQKKYRKTRKYRFFERMPWGGVRVAFRLNSIRKANIWFTPLFGGGSVFPSGEDSFWLLDAKRKGLTFYVSKETIGKVSFESSSWFKGQNENFFFGKGAFYAAVHPYTKYIWMIYFALRTKGKFSIIEKYKYMLNGNKEFKELY